MKSGNAIVGRKKKTDFDLYETPELSTRKALDKMLQDGVLNYGDELYECCCGAGAISKVLKEYGFKVKETDIQTKDFITGEKGIDVYKIESNSCKTIFTNPPYDAMTNKGNEMLMEFLRISTDKVILLLNIFYLSSKQRKELLENSPLKCVYIHSDRVTMFPYGENKPQNGGTKMFAWFVWDHEYKGKPFFDWI